MKGFYCQMVLMCVIPYSRVFFFVGMWVRFRIEKETVAVTSDTIQIARTYYCQWSKAVILCSPVSLCIFEIMHVDHPLITL